MLTTSLALALTFTGIPAAASDTTPVVDPTQLTAQAKEALATQPAVTVPAAATWTFDIPTVVVTPTPEPEPDPPVPTTTGTDQAGGGAHQGMPADPPPAQAAPAPASTVVEVALRYVGVPYVHGGTTPSGFDCSGFTQYVYAQVGIDLPRTTGAQRNTGTVIPADQARPGDLIWSPGHVGIYLGDGRQVDAPRPGKTIQARGIWQHNPTFIRPH